MSRVVLQGSCDQRQRWLHFDLPIGHGEWLNVYESKEFSYIPYNSAIKVLLRRLAGAAKLQSLAIRPYRVGIVLASRRKQDWPKQWEQIELALRSGPLRWSTLAGLWVNNEQLAFSFDLLGGSDHTDVASTPAAQVIRYPAGIAAGNDLARERGFDTWGHIPIQAAIKLDHDVLRLAQKLFEVQGLVRFELYRDEIKLVISPAFDVHRIHERVTAAIEATVGSLIPSR